MHSEIDRFWKDAGYDVMAVILLTPKESTYTWFNFYAFKPEWRGIDYIIIASYKDKILYYWDNVGYPEEQMLKIIKLKAFL